MSQRISYSFPWPRYPAIRIAFLFGTGSLLARFTELSIQFWGITLLFVLSAWVLSEIRFRSSLQLVVHLLSLLACLLSILLFGALRMSYLEMNRNELIQTAEKLHPFFWEELQVTGVIQSRHISSAGRPVSDIRTDTLFINEMPWPITISVRLYGDTTTEPFTKLLPGSRITGILRLFDLAPPSNPHEFDYRGFLIRKGIPLHGEWQELRHIEPPVQHWNWHTLRNRFHHRIEQLFPDDTSHLAKALLAGYKEEIEEEERLRFQRAGLAHIMAVSGLHVGFLAAPFWLIIPWIWGSRTGRISGLLMITLLLLLYAGVTGFSASVCRASLMAGMLTAGKLFHKAHNSLNILGASALILLILDPNQLFDPGFQLSYSAVGIILLALPTIKEWIPTAWRGTFSEKILLLIAISAIVQAGLFPVLAIWFQEFSIAGPLANLLAIPALTIFVPFSLLLVTLSPLFPAAALSLNTVNIKLLQWIRFIAGEIGSLEGSWLETGPADGWILPIWILGLGLFATGRIPSLRWKYLSLLLILLNLYQGSMLLNKQRPSSLTLTLLDVGQGDAIHLRTPGGRDYLIDTGRWAPAGDSGTDVVIPYLKRMGIEKLDGVVVTHPHADHLGGLPALITSVDIDTIYTNGVAHTSGLYHEFQKRSVESEVPERHLRSGDSIQADPSIRLFVLGPEESGHRSNLNNQSVVLLLVYNHTRFLLAGDAERSQEGELADRYGDLLQADLLKVSHHGSRSSSHPRFLNYVSPSIAAASLSFWNRFGHPHPETVNRLQKQECELFFTSLDGALIFRSDGTIIRPLDWREKKVETIY
ncbi:MAG: DNA internalization-related competence protein ComEC/Rec2 [Balneolaceae bacterium]